MTDVSRLNSPSPWRITGLSISATIVAWILVDCWRSDSALSTDPVAAREPERLRSLRRQVEPQPNPWSDAPLQNLNRTDNPGGILYSLKLPRDAKPSLTRPNSFELTEIQSTNRVQIGPGVVFLESIHSQLPQRVAAEFPESETAPKVFDHSNFYKGVFPKVTFEVALEGMGSIRVIDAQAVDATSGRDLFGSGFSYIEGADGITIWSYLKTWSPRSIYLALDIAHGDATIESHRLSDPLNVSFTEEKFQLLDAMDGVFERPFLVTRKTIGGKPHDLRTRLGPIITRNRDESTGDPVYYNDGLKPVTATRLSDRSRYGLNLERGQTSESNSSTWVFFFSPSAAQTPLRIEFLDARGNVIPIASSYAESSFQTFELECAIADVQSIRTIRHSTIRRLLFEIPRVPGLPEANLHVRDLFDLEIPYIRLRNHSTLSSAVWDSTQISPPFPTLNTLLGNRPPAGMSYPLEFTNTTPRDLFSIYKKTVGSGSFIVVDKKTHGAAIKDRFWRRISKRVRSLKPQILPPGSTP